MVEIIDKIKTAEENAEELKRLARRTGAQIRDDAAAKGRRLLEEKTAEAARQSAEILGEAEDKAGAYLEGSRKKSEELCKELRDSAGARMDKAAGFIVERIVGGL